MRCCSVRNGFGLALLAAALLPPLVVAAALPDPNSATSIDLSARQISAMAADLFRTGQFAAALSQVNAALEASPGDAQLLCLKGDILFRESRFTDAEGSYQAVLDIGSAVSHQAHAYWGLGRLAVARSRSTEARENFAAAFRLAPRDTDIIWSYAEFAPDTSAHVALLRRFLQLAAISDSQRREEAAASLRLFEQLGARQASHVISGDKPYQFKLSDFSSSEAALKGARVDVRINGNGPFRMLLDSGAEGIFLNSRSARKLKLEPVADARVRGLGGQEARGQHDSAGLMLASTLSIPNRRSGGDWQMENILVTVMDLNWLPEIDGVIGTEVFKDFLVRIDAHSKVLELLPYADGASGSPAEKGVAPMYRFGHRLLVRGSGAANEVEGLSVTSAGDGNRSGYFMLDTGASFTVLASRPLENNGRAKQAVSKASEVSLRGAQGFVEGATAAVPVRVAIAEQQYVDPNPVSVDLTAMSQQAGVEIAGILGYPLLQQSVLTINYRDGFVAFASTKR